MPPPQTRTRLTLASFACASRVAYRARSTRVGNASSGIQLTPLTSTGRSLTTSWKGVPAASGAVSQRRVRNPTRRVAVSSTSSPAVSPTRTS